MQLRLRIILISVSQTPPILRSPEALVTNAFPQAPDVLVAGLGSCIHLEANCSVSAEQWWEVVALLQRHLEAPILWSNQSKQ